MSAGLWELDESDGVAVARLRGDIDLVNVPALADQLRQHAGTSSVGLVVDVAEVRYLDSAGMQMLFQLAQELAVCRKRLAVALPEDAPLRMLFRLTSFHDAASLCPSVPACLEALRAGDFLQY